MSGVILWLALGAIATPALGLLIADLWYDIKDNDWDKDHGSRD